jgi:hypothetical protein
MRCAACTDEARCDRAGLCQLQARQQLTTPPCPVCKGDMLVDATGFCDLEVCGACNGTGRANTESQACSK